MDPRRRPTRFIVIPRPAPASGRRGAPSPRQTQRLLQLLPPRGTAATPPPTRDAEGPVTAPRLPVKVVNSSPADGALLLEPQRRLSIEQLKARAPAGTKVIEEQWYRLERPARPWRRQAAGLRKPRVRAGQGREWQITVVLDAPDRRRLSHALVTVMTDEARAIGLEARTDRFGRASFLLSERTTRVEAVYVDPLHGGWPVRLVDVRVTPRGFEAAVPPIDLAAPDVRGLVYGEAPADAGRGVAVGVVDTGIGPHEALRVAGGRNTTTAESIQRWRDEEGHGSHVAGVIAAAAAGLRRGEASAVSLHAYRIFEAGDPFASTFAIQAAIKQAVLDGCDLINLSIGDSMADESVRDAVEFAWARGSVCIAATGNDGKGQVDYPARYPHAVAVSAMGLEGSWPATAFVDWVVSRHRGRKLGGKTVFLAGFSNRGAKVALTAPGVAVVSTIFDDRWGVMSGTSMATPIATGVIARRLAASPAVREMPRNADRAAAIVTLALEHAEDIGLPATMQGRGLAR